MSTQPAKLSIEVNVDDSEEAWKDFQDSVIAWEDQFASTDVAPLEEEVVNTVPAPLLDDFDIFSSVTRKSP